MSVFVLADPRSAAQRSVGLSCVRQVKKKATARFPGGAGLAVTLAGMLAAVVALWLLPRPKCRREFEKGPAGRVCEQGMAVRLCTEHDK
jgi:hypothetical protein